MSHMADDELITELRTRAQSLEFSLRWLVLEAVRRLENEAGGKSAVDPVHYAGGTYCHECERNLYGYCMKNGLRKVTPGGFCSDGTRKENET